MYEECSVCIHYSHPSSFVHVCSDRRNVYWDPANPLDPALFRHKSVPGDFELESLQLEDLLITVYQPGGFRPYTTSVFRADVRQFRKRWLFYDFLCAENVVGQFDNCLFSLHKPQSIGRTTDKDLEDGEWARLVSLVMVLSALINSSSYRVVFVSMVLTLTISKTLPQWRDPFPG